jgi:hypothetical protein
MGIRWSHMQAKAWKYNLQIQTLNIFIDVVIWSIIWTPCSYEQTSNLLAIPSFGFVAGLVLTPDFCDKEFKSFPQIVDMS